MAKMVTARVPDALFEQASIQLEKIGATTSELVNAAFEYVLQKKSLPKASSTDTTDRHLSKEKREELAQIFKACSLNLDIPTDPAYDKRIIQEERVKRYETLA